jgi:hypothetical protein
MTEDDTVRLTYQELADARGISLGAAKRLVYRHRWQKQVGNDGLSHVLIPRSFVTRDISEDMPADIPADDTDDVTADPPAANGFTLEEAVSAFAAVTRDLTRDVVFDVTRDVIGTLQEAITSLRVELYAERDRANRAETENRELRERLARPWWRRRI